MYSTLTNLIKSPQIHYNLPVEELINQSLSSGEGILSDTGALVVATGEFTGRSPKDKFIVKDAITTETVDWNNFNNPISEYHFMHLRESMLEYLNKKETVWVRDVFACPTSQFKMGIRVVTESAYASFFTANMLSTATTTNPDDFTAEWLILQAPGFKADTTAHGTRQHNFAIVSFEHKTILIGGTAYTGEIKKSVFTILNFLLPYNHNVLAMHCSANVGKDGDTAIFFGLSGTGKTTLSTDPDRKLVGDDEHGWSGLEVFNFESGCYAKVINLSHESEPEIYGAIRKGALVENTAFYHGTNTIDFANTAITENTRVSYPLSFIKGALLDTVADTPENIFFLTCDAHGVMPPISKLTTQQAMYYFISGYTARVAGTEAGILQPQSTFSTCFGAPFLPLHPGFYASILGGKIAATKVNVWMVNTGWTAGPYGIGSRIKLSATRAMVNAALNGALEDVAYIEHPVFKVAVPQECPGVDAQLLNPEQTWENKEDYTEVALLLAKEFHRNFEKYAPGVDPEVRDAGPFNTTTSNNKY
jgi:phosphoenolpyruvate carboxykinase (ATP)